MKYHLLNNPGGVAGVPQPAPASPPGGLMRSVGGAATTGPETAESDIS